MQEVWTIYRIIKRQPQQQKPVGSNAPPPLLAESSSNMGSF
jgi:hypothetical protein